MPVESSIDVEAWTKLQGEIIGGDQAWNQRLHTQTRRSFLFLFSGFVIAKMAGIDQQAPKHTRIVRQEQSDTSADATEQVVPIPSQNIAELQPGTTLLRKPLHISYQTENGEVHKINFAVDIDAEHKACYLTVDGVTFVASNPILLPNGEEMTAADINTITIEEGPIEVDDEHDREQEAIRQTIVSITSEKHGTASIPLDELPVLLESFLHADNEVTVSLPDSAKANPRDGVLAAAARLREAMLQIGMKHELKMTFAKSLEESPKVAQK